MKCGYSGCEESIFQDYDYCVLHLPLPPPSSGAFVSIKKLKQKEIEKKKEKNDYDFRGAKLIEVDLNNLNIKDDIIFTQSYIENNFECSNTNIEGDVWFDQSKVGGHFFCENSYIDGSISSFKAIIGGNLCFDNTLIGKYCWFEKAEVDGEISFNHTKIGASISFKNAKITENISFYAAKIGEIGWFNDAILGGNNWFDLADFKGGLNFIKTRFQDIKGQEKACRRAKTIWESLGDRAKADYHFYREMEAKRKQKPFYSRYLELIVQYPFGYGVYPSRLLLTFFLAMFIFAFLYWFISGFNNSEGLLKAFKFSFLTMIIPAYGVINAQEGLYGLLTIIQAFIGAFTWPTFIVTFARKYMR